MTESNNKACKDKSPKIRVRDRIFEAAAELFYRQGVHNVAIDTIVEEAQTNKMSLYRNFQSKDELVVEYIKQLNSKFEFELNRILSENDTNARAAIVAIFANIAERPKEETCHGCPSANIAIELRGQFHPALEPIFQIRESFRDILFELSKSAGAKDPKILANTLVLLFEGCVLSKVTFSEQQWPGANVRLIIENLLDKELGVQST